MLRSDMIARRLVVETGSVTCIPYANFQAFHEKKRQIEENMNRIFGRKSDTWEGKVVPFLEKAIEQHDFVLDLHSVTSGDAPFAFNDFGDDPCVGRIISRLPVSHVMSGWTELYPEPTELDTIGYAKLHNKTGVTVECGQHDDPHAVSVAHECILSMLGSLGVIGQDERDRSVGQVWIHVDTIVRRA